MKRDVVLFDLDGTLLPLDQDAFTKSYFSRLASHLLPHGYDPNKVVADVWEGTKAMVMNDGSKTNEEVFWDTFSRLYEKDVRQDYEIFEKFYETEFKKLIDTVQINLFSKEVIKKVKEKGYRVALATNPLFPRIATLERISWTGMNPDDFELVTTYETNSYCKPNPKYYEDVCRQLNVKPEQCIMVGNDVSEDGIARKLGMKVFLIDECLMNPRNEDISDFPIGSFEDFLIWLDKDE